MGEHPKAADTLGVDVISTRYINVLLGSLIAGLGGAWFTLEAVDVFNPMMTNGLGFIGLAAMIVGNWMPLGALFGAFIFGLGSAHSAVAVHLPTGHSVPVPADGAVSVDHHRGDRRRRPRYPPAAEGKAVHEGMTFLPKFWKSRETLKFSERRSPS